MIFCFAAAAGVNADPVTYRQLRQDQGGRALNLASLPSMSAANEQSSNVAVSSAKGLQGQGGSAQNQAPKVQESPNHPEFVRLPDGRIVRYGPGVLCDENCIDTVSTSAFGNSTGPSIWWVAPPVAGGILCAMLCRSSESDSSQPIATITIPQTSPTPTSTLPTPSPSGTATPPPPQEIPEPGTLVLLGLGLGTMLARRRKKASE